MKKSLDEDAIQAMALQLVVRLLSGGAGLSIEPIRPRLNGMKPPTLLEGFTIKLTPP